jgi:hypothetical protein
LLPFVKLRTAASGIGNGNVAGGIAVPINYCVPDDWVVTLRSQFNILANADGSGRHAGVSGLISVAKSFGAVG